MMIDELNGATKPPTILYHNSAICLAFNAVMMYPTTAIIKLRYKNIFCTPDNCKMVIPNTFDIMSEFIGLDEELPSPNIHSKSMSLSSLIGNNDRNQILSLGYSCISQLANASANSRNVTDN